MVNESKQGESNSGTNNSVKLKPEKVSNIDSKPDKYDNIYKKIVKIVDKDRVNKDEFERRLYSHDVAALPKMIELAFKITPDLVVRPRSAKEISEIVKLASKENIPIVPRGGASWGLGGAVPINGGIVLDMTSMNQIIEIDEDNLSATVESGINWKLLYDTLMRKGYMIGAYPSSAFAASIGGWINTGGVGVGTYKYGSVGDQLRSMEVVLPNGNIIETGFKKVISNSSGYNLTDLFLSSEGTLGVVSKVTLKIYPAPEEIRPLSYDFSKLESLCTVTKKIARAKVVPLHLGFLDKNHFEYLKQIRKNVPPVSKILLNIALEGDSKMLDYEEEVMDRIAKSKNGTKLDGKIAQHEWDERYYEMRTKKVGPTLITGEAMTPIPTMLNMFNGIYAIFKKMKLRGAIAGFVSDRNTITFMPYYLTDERKMVRSLLSMSFVKKLSDLSFKNGGRPAGLGLFFASNLKKLHGTGVELMHDLKSAIDPYNIMNPGKLIEGLTRYGVPIPSLAMNLGMDSMALMKRIMGKDTQNLVKSGE
jgi:glycolate oxidase